MLDPSMYRTDIAQILEFVQGNKIVTESARAAVPAVVRFMVAHDYSGNWWSLPNSSLIYNALQAVKESSELLVCRLVEGKVSYVHRECWAPLSVLQDYLPHEALAKVQEVHLPSGRHTTSALLLSEWMPADVRKEAAGMTTADAVDRLEAMLPTVEFRPLAAAVRRVRATSGGARVR
jgi:hypothetical protein